jgi:hypothetical protein
MIFELALLMYVLVTWYLYNNFPELILQYSNALPIVALLCYYILASLKF